jgi:hypothetical protein
MTQIVLPDAALSQLASIPGPASICDASGHVLGTYIPQVAHDAELYAQNPCPISIEVHQRRRNEGGGKSLAEFWKGLGVQP